MNQNFIVAVDFDGTIVEHRFPKIGMILPGAIHWLHRFVREYDAKLILWTMRCREGSMGDVLSPAVEYCRVYGIEFWGVNENPQQKESRWSTSGKVYAHCYVDDMNAGTPLIHPPNGDLPYVNWDLVGPHVLSVLDWLQRAGKVRINTAELNQGGSVYSDRLNTSPQVELPTPALVIPQG